MDNKQANDWAEQPVDAEAATQPESSTRKFSRRTKVLGALAALSLVGGVAYGVTTVKNGDDSSFNNGHFQDGQQFRDGNHQFNGGPGNDGQSHQFNGGPNGAPPNGSDDRGVDPDGDNWTGHRQPGGPAGPGRHGTGGQNGGQTLGSATPTPTPSA